MHSLQKMKNPETYGNLFHSISVCFNKGLGCPAGSMLLGTEKFIHQARRVRKVFGGGMRQAGFLAATALYALDHHVERLATDHHACKKNWRCTAKTSTGKNGFAG